MKIKKTKNLKECTILLRSGVSMDTIHDLHNSSITCPKCDWSIGDKDWSELEQNSESFLIVEKPIKSKLNFSWENNT